MSRRCQVRTANYPKSTSLRVLHSVFHQVEECECDGALEGRWRVGVCGVEQCQDSLFRNEYSSLERKKISDDCCAGKLMDYLNKAFASLNKTRGSIAVSS